MIIDNFLDYLKNTRNMSDNTLLAYRRDIMAFDRFMRKQGINELEKATNTNIISYLMFLKTDGKSKSTVNRRLASLRSFFRFLQNQGTIRENPTDDIRSPKIARKEISFLSQEDVKKLLEMPDDSVMGIRDKAILEMMYATGVRVSEIIEMKVTDLNLRMGFVACSGDH